MSFNRRSFLKFAPSAAVATTALGSAKFSVGQDAHHVVVIGGGFAGATTARYLARWGANQAIKITLVDPKPEHTSCIMSNLILNGQLTKQQLSFSFDTLNSQYGISVVQGSAETLDASSKTVGLGDGTELSYDALVVTGGIDFVTSEGYDSSLTPHAWIAGDQTELLKAQIDGMPDDGTYILSIPKAPYRCPPGPYERACVVANILGSRTNTLGANDNRAAPRVLVLDGNDDIIVEKENFERAFAELYGNIVEYLPAKEVVRVDSAEKTVITSDGNTYRGDVVNVIPKQQATAFVRNSGLTNGGLWAPVDPVSYASTVAGFNDVYVVGDAASTKQPKSGHMANSQAKICADAILRKAMGSDVNATERLANIMTNSACYSPVSATEATWLTAVFRYDVQTGQMAGVPEAAGASRGWSEGSYSRMFEWSNNLLADTFL